MSLPRFNSHRPMRLGQTEPQEFCYGSKTMEKVKRNLIWLVLHIEEIIAVSALAVMLCAIFYNVMMRYLFRNPSAWADELSMICLAYVTFVGGAAAYKRNLHFGIDILLDLMPLKLRMLVRQAVNLVFIVLFGYAAYLGYNLYAGAVKVFNYSGWSYKIMDAALPLGFLSMTIYAVYFFVQSFVNKDAYRRRYETNYEETAVDEELVKESQRIFEGHKEEGSEEA